MSPDTFREMVSDLLRVSSGKIRVPKQMPPGGWTVADILVNDKPLTMGQSQALTDILFWHQWWETGHTIVCPKCNHKMDAHNKITDTRAGCRHCTCICEIDTGVYILDGDTTVIQALIRLRKG